MTDTKYCAKCGGVTSGEFDFHLTVCQCHKTCQHDWTYDNCVLMAEKPYQNKICRKCGLKDTEIIQNLIKSDYDEVVKKWK